MIQGRKFEPDLENADEDGKQTTSAVPAAFVGDVLERRPDAPAPPSFPLLKNKSGFPDHGQRRTESRFKQGTVKQGIPATAEVPDIQQVGSDRPEATTNQHITSGKTKSWDEEEKQRIDLENRQKLAQMSSEEIEEERQELMNSLSPALLQRLLQRSNIESGSTEANLSNQSETTSIERQKAKAPNAKSVSFVEPVVEDHASPMPTVDAGSDVDTDEVPIAEDLLHDTVHFPRAPQPPDLDPSSDTFLEDLHEKYFPSLPSDPDKLQWMRSSNSDRSPYDPSASALKPKDLRFSFKGQLIPPKTASNIPVTAGLHHHGIAPDAAGYTIPELAHLAHSSFAPQRCVAFQTLGRILYRLGRGEFGDSGEPGADTAGVEDTFGELARSLWREMENAKVVETLVNESAGTGVDGGRHVSAKAYATEAVWLWRKGGGRTWKAG